jgi:hypothetical protein
LLVLICTLRRGRIKKGVGVSPDGGATWHIVPWEADGSWEYDWDTTQGPNGVFALIARATDEAGNITTDQVNVIVDNAPPTVTLTESGSIWETAHGSVFKNVIPLGSIQLTVECGDQPDRVYNYNVNNGAFDFKWDRRCGDGNLAPSGTYTVVLEACDIYDNCDEARGKVNIPFAAPIMPTSTPMPTLEKTEVIQQWYSNPTSIPSATSPPQTSVLPVLPMTGSQTAPDDEIPSGNNQPLLPLAAAALGTSVLLAASSKREEREAQAAARLEDMLKSSQEDQAANQAGREASVAAHTVATVNEETPYVEVSTLAALAGVVKETFSGVCEDAVRISPADAPTVHIYTNWVNGVDPIAYYEENGARLAAKAKFWNDYWIASQKKYYEEQRLNAIKEAKEKAIKEFLEEIARQDRETQTAKNAAQSIIDYQERIKAENLAAEAAINARANEAARQAAQSFIVSQERIKQENIAQAKRDELTEQQAKTQAYYAASIAAYQEKKEQEEKIQSQKDKLTEMENATKDKNVITQHDYSEIAKAFHDKESKADEEYEAYEADQWQEKYGGNSFAQYSSLYEQVELNPYEAFHSGMVDTISEEELEPMPAWMAEMTLSMTHGLGLDCNVALGPFRRVCRGLGVPEIALTPGLAPLGLEVSSPPHLTSPPFPHRIKETSNSVW